MTASREALIVRAQGGDALALNALLVECQADARRYALRHCVTSEIDDAVQEALLVVTRHVRSLKTAASFAGWLFTIVRRECSRLSRKMFPHAALDEDEISARLQNAPKTSCAWNWRSPSSSTAALSRNDPVARLRGTDDRRNMRAARNKRRHSKEPAASLAPLGAGIPSRRGKFGG